MDVDTALPLDSWRQAQQINTEGGRRAASVNVQRIGEDIVNSISIHRIQDEEAHLDDIVAVLTNNDKTVRIYSLPSGTETACLDLQYFMNHATLSPDGQTLVAVGDMNLAYFFTREITQAPPQIHKPHNRLTSASVKWTLTRVVKLHVSEQASTMCYFTTAWNPSGQLVAVGSEGGYITVFDIGLLNDADVEDGDTMVAVVPGSRPDLTAPHPGAIRTMMFSPDPWDLLMWAEDQGRICIGDLRTGLKSRQIITLDPKEENLRRLAYEDVTTDDVMNISTESRLMLDQRELDELEADIIRRYRQGGEHPIGYEAADARRRHRQQRVDMSAVRSQVLAQRDYQQQAALLDDPRGLTAREQQVLDNLRTARQQEEARLRSGGQSRGVNYTSADMFRDASTRSAATTVGSGDSSTRPISDILSSMQDSSFPELARTNAASTGSRPRSSHGPATPDSLPSLVSMQDSRRGSAASQWAATTNSLVRLSDGSRLPRRRASVVLTPPTTDSPPGSTRGPAASAAGAAAEEDQNPWRTIEEHMSLARGPLFETARSRLQESAARATPPSGIRDYASLPTTRPTESDLTADLAAERARARSIARQRDRMRTLREGTSPSAAGTTTVGPNPSAAERAFAFPSQFAQGNELLLRRAQLQQMQQMRASYAREVGVKTAGLAMSADGRTLWAACEEGIFEVDVGVKGRMFWPAVEPR